MGKLRSLKRPGCLGDQKPLWECDECGMIFFLRPVWPTAIMINQYSYDCMFCEASKKSPTSKMTKEEIEIKKRSLKNGKNLDCEHNWVMDGHNAGDPICSKCFSRE